MRALRFIRRRLVSIKTTEKITRAMKIVATAKLQSAEARYFSAKTYADLLGKVIKDLVYRTDPEGLPLLGGREEEKVLEVLIVGSDRGLCGSFNSTLFRFVSKHIEEQSKKFEKIQVSVIGRKARDFFEKFGLPIRKRWIGYITGKGDYPRALEVAEDVLDTFNQEGFDRLHIIYNSFVSRLSFKPSVLELIPLSAFANVKRENFVEFKYEPEREKILQELLPWAVKSGIFRVFLESFASEQIARMTAMDNATRNAEEMIESLTLTYNRARQESITKELMDIVNGAEALKRGGVGL